MSEIKDANRRRARRRKQGELRLLICALLFMFVFIFAMFVIKAVVYKKKEKSEPEKNTESRVDTSNITVNNFTVSDTPEHASPKDPVSITVSAVGDCTLGTDVNFDQSKSLNAYYNSQGPDYFLKNVRTFFENDDLTIVNMEGTLTTEEQREEKTYAFKGPPEYASILSGSSVEAANLGNNHSKDYGETSYTDTIKHLEDAGIATFGFDQTAILKVKGIKVGVAGIYELAEHLEKKQQVKEAVAALKEAGAQLIIVNFHWGVEREYEPNDIQRALAHLAVDEGADLVIGHHPHVLQSIEKYKGRYIAYSLGNFCFGGNNGPEDMDTMIFQQTFTITGDGAQKNDTVNIIPCSLSSSGGFNDYCPTPLEGSEKERALEKINMQ